MSRLLLVIFLCAGIAVISKPHPAEAQQLKDTLFVWQGYARPGTCRVRIYNAAPEIQRQHVVVVQELAENHGPTTISDTAYLVEEISRKFGLDPTSTYWVLHWGAFSFEGNRKNRQKELFLRATFRRTKGHRLGAPQWRVLRREDVEGYTDRHFR